MSFSYRYMLVATMTSAPAGLVTWLDGCISGGSPEPLFDVPEVAAEMLGDAAWLLGLAGRLASQGPDGSTRELAVFVSNVHDDMASALYGLPFVIAPYCDDGTIAVMWTDMNPDVDPILFFVQSGVPFVGKRNGLPVPAVDSDAGPPAWALGLEPPTARELVRLGIEDGGTLMREERYSGVPSLARHLLARSVVRRLRDIDFEALLVDELGTEAERVRLQAAARIGAKLTLDVIETGGDPLLVKNTPGWQLQEVLAQDRYMSQAPRGSGRPLTRLTEALDEVVEASLDAGPRRLFEGEVIIVLAPLVLVARGPMTSTTDEALSGSNHELTIEVPVGSQLLLTRVYDRGHAECRPVGTDFTAWIRPAGHRHGHLAEPVAALEEYTLGWIQPEDEGSLFERRP